MSSLASIPRTITTSWTSGASKRQRMSRLKPFLTWPTSTSQWSGRRRMARSSRASGLSSIGAAKSAGSLLPGAVRLGRRQADAVPIFPTTSGATKVYLPRNAVWIGDVDVLGELLSFPAGRTDDVADAMGLLGRGSSTRWSGQAFLRWKRRRPSPLTTWKVLHTWMMVLTGRKPGGPFELVRASSGSSTPPRTAP